MTGLAQVLFPSQANGSMIEKDGKVVGSGADRAGLRRRQILPRAAVCHQRARSQGCDQDGRRALQCRELHGGSNLGPDQQGADRARQG